MRRSNDSFRFVSLRPSLRFRHVSSRDKIFTQRAAGILQPRYHWTVCSISISSHRQPWFWSTAFRLVRPPPAPPSREVGGATQHVAFGSSCFLPTVGCLDVFLLSDFEKTFRLSSRDESFPPEVSWSRDSVHSSHRPLTCQMCHKKKKVFPSHVAMHRPSARLRLEIRPTTA